MSATDAGLDTVVAGVRCRDVLEELSELLDGTMTMERRAAIDGHLAGCDRCSRFGGDVSKLIGQLRASMGAPPPLPAGRSSELRASLRRIQLG